MSKPQTTYLIVISPQCSRVSDGADTFRTLAHQLKDSAHPLIWNLRPWPLLESSLPDLPGAINIVAARVREQHDEIATPGYAMVPHAFVRVNEARTDVAWAVRNPWRSGLLDVFGRLPQLLCPDYPSHRKADTGVHSIPYELDVAPGPRALTGRISHRSARTEDASSRLIPVLPFGSMAGRSTGFGGSFTESFDPNELHGLAGIRSEALMLWFDISNEQDVDLALSQITRLPAPREDRMTLDQVFGFLPAGTPQQAHETTYGPELLCSLLDAGRLRAGHRAGDDTRRSLLQAASARPAPARIRNTPANSSADTDPDGSGHLQCGSIVGQPEGDEQGHHPRTLGFAMTGVTRLVGDSFDVRFNSGIPSQLVAHAYEKGPAASLLEGPIAARIVQHTGKLLPIDMESAVSIESEDLRGLRCSYSSLHSRTGIQMHVRADHFFLDDVDGMFIDSEVTLSWPQHPRRTLRPALMLVPLTSPRKGASLTLQVDNGEAAATAMEFDLDPRTLRKSGQPVWAASSVTARIDEHLVTIRLLERDSEILWPTQLTLVKDGRHSVVCLALGAGFRPRSATRTTVRQTILITVDEQRSLVDSRLASRRVQKHLLGSALKSQGTDSRE